MIAPQLFRQVCPASRKLFRRLQYQLVYALALFCLFKDAVPNDVHGSLEIDRKGVHICMRLAQEKADVVGFRKQLRQQLGQTAHLQSTPFQPVAVVPWHPSFKTPLCS